MRWSISSLVLLAALAAAPGVRAGEVEAAGMLPEGAAPPALDEQSSLRVRYSPVYRTGSQQDTGPGLLYRGVTPNDFGLQLSWFGSGWLGLSVSGEREGFSLFSGSGRVAGGGLARASAAAAGRWALGPLRVELGAGYGFSQLAYFGSSTAPALLPGQRHALDLAGRLRLELPLGMRVEVRGELPMALAARDGDGRPANAAGYAAGGALAIPVGGSDTLGVYLLADFQLTSDRLASNQNQFSAAQRLLRAGLALELAWLRPEARLPRTGGLELRVVDAETAAPVAGAAVSVRAGGVVRSATSGVDGRALADTLPPGPAVASVAVTGYLPAEATARVEAGREQPLEVRLQRAPRVGGVAVAVVDKETGQPVPGARVKVQGQELPVGPTGQVSVGELPPGPVPISATAEGYTPAQEVASVVVGKTSPVTLQMVKATARLLATLTGQVRSTRGGRPIPALLEIPEAKVRTRAGSGGTFTIRLPGGTYTVHISAPGYLAQRKSVAVKDGEEAIFNVDLHPERQR